MCNSKFGVSYDVMKFKIEIWGLFVCYELWNSDRGFLWHYVWFKIAMWLFFYITKLKLKFDVWDYEV
jgi:hypothetical protein